MTPEQLHSLLLLIADLRWVASQQQDEIARLRAELGALRDGAATPLLDVHQP